MHTKACKVVRRSEVIRMEASMKTDNINIVMGKTTLAPLWRNFSG